MTARGSPPSGQSPRARRAGATALRLALVLVALSAALAVFTWGTEWRDFVVANGDAVPTRDVVTDYRFALFWAGLIAIGIAALPVRERDALLVIWGMKVAVALGFMLLYEDHYRVLDTFGYYLRGMADVFPRGGLLEGTTNVDRMAWIQLRLLPDSYHALKITWALMGLVACWCFWRAASRFTGRPRIVLLFAISLFPSILFWSTIFGKDPVALLGLGLLALAVVALHERRYRTAIPSLVVGYTLLLLVRPWLAPITAIPVAIPFLARLWTVPGWGRAAVLGGFIAVAAAAIGLMGHIFDVRSLSGALSYLDSVSRAWAIGGSGSTPPEFKSLWDVIAYLPFGMFTALFRPILFEVNTSMFGLMAGLENLLFVVLVLLAIVRARRGDLRHPVVASALAYVLIWAALYAFISPQNLGSAFRFRLQVLPVVLLLVAWSVRSRRRETPLDVPYKITVITPRFALSGVPLAQTRFARALASAGHDVQLLVGTVNAGHSMPSVPGVDVRVLGRERVASMLPDLVRHFRARRPDIVFTAEDHLTAITLFAAILARSRARISGSSRVTPFDTYSSIPLTKRWLLKQLVRLVSWRADALTCVSKDMVEQYRQVFHSPPHVAVYNIVADAEGERRMAEPTAEPWLAEEGSPILVAAGSLAPWKGFADLIDAMKIVSERSDARLLILGDGPLRDELGAKIKELSLEERVKLVGRVDNPLAYFARADVFVLSSHVEGMPNVLVEAMMCGATPVSTNCPTGPRELLDGGRIGELVPVKDPEALAEGILRALERPADPAVLARAVAPFEEQAVLARHFELLGLKPT